MVDVFLSVVKYAIFSILVLVVADRFEIRGNTITNYVRKTLSHAQRFAQGTPEEKVYRSKDQGAVARVVEDSEFDEDDNENVESSPKPRKVAGAPSEKKKLRSLIQRLGGA